MRPVLKVFTVAFSVSLILASVSVGCKDSNGIDMLIRQQSDFALDLYKHLGNQEGNLCFSPYGISASLAMAMAGGKGQTRKQMSEILRFPAEDNSIGALFSSMSSRIDGLNSQGSEIVISNSLWPQIGYEIRPEYHDLLKNHFRVSTNSLDFSTKPLESARSINDWVFQQTGGRIKDIVSADTLNSSTKMLIMNAISFKGQWAVKFDTSLTEKAPFFITQKRSIETSMMETTADFRHFRNSVCQGIEIPYVGNELSMCVLLPDNPDGIKVIEDELSTTNLRAWKDQLKLSRVLLHFPKFELQQSTELSKPLVSMGMRDAFDAGLADFTGIAPASINGLYISSVIQNVRVEVNEEGTQASSTTASHVSDSLSAKAPEVTSFKVDRPFIFFIKDNVSGIILFMGRMTNPGNNSSLINNDKSDKSAKPAKKEDIKKTQPSK